MNGLHLEGVCVSIGATRILDELSLTAPQGSLTALVGPNGAGKSTVLRAVVGALPVRAGTVHFDGAQLTALTGRARARTVALLEQQAATDVDLSVEDVAWLGRIPHQGFWGSPSAGDRQIVDDALREAGIADLAERRYRALSGGQQQRVRLASALAQQPRLLLADEPTNHLDIGAQLDTLALLRRLADAGLTVVAAIHDLDHALAHADHVVAMSDGRTVAEGPPADVLNPELIHRLYGVYAETVPHPVTGEPMLAYSRMPAEASQVGVGIDSATRAT